MRFSKVRGKPFTATCMACGKPTSSEDLYADLDGAPFRAYYCPVCKHAAESVERLEVKRAREFNERMSAEDEFGS